MRAVLLSFLFILMACTVFCQEKNIADVLKKFNNNSVPYIQVEDVAVNDSTVILDAREPGEYAVSKIPGAIYIGFNEFDIFTVRSLIADKKKKIIVYCSLGVRSERIGHKIKRAGYGNVFNLWGGIFEWKNEGRQVVDANNKPTENVHAYSKKWGVYLKKGIKVYG